MIYITGATGRLGKEVLKLLKNAVPLVRKPSGLENEKITDFSSEELKKILKNAEVMIHLAGSMKFADKKELWNSNVEITKNIVDSLPKKARIVFASSISVYGKNPKNPVDEKTPPKPDSEYAKSKLEAEKIVSKHDNNVVLRIGTMYGMGYGEYFRILKLINQGKMAIIGNGKNRISFVHVEDVAEAVKNSIKAETGVYVIAGDSLPQKEIYDIAAEELKAEKPKRSIPAPIAHLLTWIYEKEASFRGKNLTMTTEHIKILSSDRVFDYSKAKKELKFKPRNIRDGIRSMVSKTKL